MATVGGLMRILMSLTYYRPNVSGLTIYAERLAAALVERGHAVTVLTAQHDPSLPIEEYSNGVRIVRVPAPIAVGKAPIMPRMADTAYRLATEHDVVHLHLPQPESALVAMTARAAGKPVVLTYHCDLRLGDGMLNRAFDTATYAGNYATATLADRIVSHTQDNAIHSPLLKHFQEKVVTILPPVIQRKPNAAEIAAFRAKHQIPSGPVLGFSSRLASQKGIEYAVEAVPVLLERYPDLTVVFAGPYENVVGEAGYRDRIMAMLAPYRDHWKFVGTLSGTELAAFYGTIDLLLMTSVNTSEAFPLAQVEAMLCGAPIVTSNLPGVRQAVYMTGMGEVANVADVPSIVEQIDRVLRDRDQYLRSRAEIETIFDFDVSVARYESLFEESSGKAPNA